MENTSQNVRYLDFQKIVEINREIILQTGGFVAGAGKLSNPNSLNYLVEIVQAELDDKELYPSLHEKAAIYAYNIITRHIFLDGNKRTGMVCAFFFLLINGAVISKSISENELVEIALGIENGTINIHKVTSWFQERLD